MAETYATYSLEDDKLRLYPAARLDDEIYARVKSVGLVWAPKQECFYQVWSPGREDLCLELAGDIEDEDSTLADRAEARAARFAGYSNHAAERAEQAQKAVSAIADGIPFGQPIICGHHSQRHAERDAEKIRNGMRRAIDEMKATEYWRGRAHATLAHADYKVQPGVIARRIKRLEAERRKQVKEQKTSQTLLTAWDKIADDATREQAMALANYDSVSFCFTLAKYPRDHDTYEGAMGLWSALDREIISTAQARALAMPLHERTVAWRDRWIEHLDNRLAYEKELLADQGGLAVDKKPLEIGGAVKYMGCWLEITRLNKSGGVVVSASTVAHPRYGWRREVRQVTDIKEFMTKAEYVMAGKPVYAAAEPVDSTPVRTVQEQPWEALEEAAENVQAVSAPELFPTPQAVLDRMSDWVDFESLPTVPWKDGRHRVDFLEPEAGTGAIIQAVLGRWTAIAVTVECCELNYNLAEGLARAGFKVVPDGVNSDFLEYKPGPFYGLIVANPPFSREVEHVRHMYECLAPGGQLVTVMSEGPFFRSFHADVQFRSWLEAVGGESETLPDGSFLPATGVRTRLVSIKKERTNGN